MIILNVFGYFLMKTCAELFSIFQKFHAKVRTQFNTSIRILRSDNAKEYFFVLVSFFISSHGILHQSSCGYSHSILFPNQPLFYLFPHVFGCVCFVHILTPGQDKLFANATKCVFLGYSRLQRGYKCYSTITNQYFISADVIFFEDSSFLSTAESHHVFDVLHVPLVLSSPNFPYLPTDVVN